MPKKLGLLGHLLYPHAFKMSETGCKFELSVQHSCHETSRRTFRFNWKTVKAHHVVAILLKLILSNIFCFLSLGQNDWIAYPSTSDSQVILLKISYRLFSQLSSVAVAMSFQ